MFNKRGGSRGRLLNIVIASDSNEPRLAREVAQELIKDSNVLGVIGHNASKASQVALAEYEEADLAMISSTSTSTLLSRKKVFFRTVSSDQLIAETLANYVISHNLKRIVIFYTDQDIYSDNLKQEFEKFIKQPNGEVVRTVNLNDFRLNASTEVLKSVFEDQADAAVFFPNTEQISTVIEIARAQKNLIQKNKLNFPRKLQLLGGDALYSQDTLMQDEEAVEGLVLAVPWSADAPNSKEFARRAKEIWGWKEPLVSWRVATSYDATQAFIAALSKSDKPSRATVIQNLKSINLSSNETSGGELHFSDIGESQEKPVLVQVVKGGYSSQLGFRRKPS